MPQRIIVAGLKRSGTHWVFNAVRLLCAQASPGAVWAGQHDAYTGQEAALWHVVKSHDYRPQLAHGAQVVTSFRALPAVLDSHERMTGRRPDLDEVSRWLVHLLWWQQRACHWVWYPHLVQFPRRELARLAQALGLAADVAAVQQQLAQLRPPPGPPDTAVRDPVSLLFQGHMREEGDADDA